MSEANHSLAISGSGVVSSPLADALRAESTVRRRSVFRLPAPFYFGVVLALSSATLTSNPPLTAASILALAVVVLLLWEPGEPPALLFAALLQWDQVAMKVFHADYYGRSVASMSYAQHGDEAIWLGLVGVVVLALGMRIGASRRKRGLPALVDQQLRNISIQRVFLLYLPASAFSWYATAVWSRFESVAQIVMMAARLKWVLYYLLAYLVMRRRTQRGYLLIATLIEFITGIGYFSDFRMVFFVLLIVFLALNRRITLRLATLATAATVALIMVALAWTAIKREYRTYLNAGTGRQVTLVSPLARITTFVSMISSLRLSDLAGQGDKMVRRIEYTDYFAAVIDYVPAQRPFEDGALLMRAINHILMPRFLFPNKPVLSSDSELTSEYTGMELAGADEGTSISLGYMGEDYIDFGPVGMFFVVLGLGCVCGLMYAYLVNRAPSLGVGYAFGTALLIYMGDFAMAQVKLIGGMVAGFLVFAVILRYVAPSALRMLSTPQFKTLSSIDSTFSLNPVGTPDAPFRSANN